MDVTLAEQRSDLEGFGLVEPTRTLNFLQEEFWPIMNSPVGCYRATLIRGM